MFRPLVWPSCYSKQSWNNPRAAQSKSSKHLMEMGVKCLNMNCTQRLHFTRVALLATTIQLTLSRFTVEFSLFTLITQKKPQTGILCFKYVLSCVIAQYVDASPIYLKPISWRWSSRKAIFCGQDARTHKKAGACWNCGQFGCHWRCNGSLPKSLPATFPIPGRYPQRVAPLDSIRGRKKPPLALT